MEIIELATRLSIEEQKNVSAEELIKLGDEAGISRQCMYKAIAQIRNNNRNIAEKKNQKLVLKVAKKKAKYL